MKCIARNPEAQIPDGTKWLEGDRVIFSRQQSTSSAKSSKCHSSTKEIVIKDTKVGFLSMLILHNV